MSVPPRRSSSIRALLNFVRLLSVIALSGPGRGGTDTLVFGQKSNSAVRVVRLSGTVGFRQRRSVRPYRAYGIPTKASLAARVTHGDSVTRVVVPVISRTSRDRFLRHAHIPRPPHCSNRFDSKCPSTSFGSVIVYHSPCARSYRFEKSADRGTVPEPFETRFNWFYSSLSVVR